MTERQTGMSERSAEAAAVVETRLTHAMHRRATTVLADAVPDPSVPLAALAELREFLVVNLRHHHETEDDWLWPSLAEVAPQAAAGLARLGEEHERLDDALDALQAVPAAWEDERPSLRAAAAEVRELVHLHLEHEEPLLFPVLRDQLPSHSWTAFSQRVIATAPPVAPHLLFGFFDQVGTAAEVAQVLAGVPEPVRELVPALTEQGRAALAVLAGARAAR